MSEWSVAPYNFVPLPEAPVPSPLNDKFPDGNGPVDMEQSDVIERYRAFIEENIAKGDAYSGEITLDITTKTPFFIGGKKTNDDRDMLFFAPDGWPRIPGSSIRGMTKNLFKILTCGAFRKNDRTSEDGDFWNRHLYFRSMTEKSSVEGFQAIYKERLGIKSNRGTSGKMHSVTGAKQGFLVRRDGAYFIIPTVQTERESWGKDDSNRALGQGDVPKVDWQDTYCKCYTAKMSNKNHYDIFTAPVWEKITEAQEMPLSQENIDDYENDNKRGNANSNPDKQKAWNLFEGHNLCKFGADAKSFTHRKYDFVAPCYYMAKDKKVLHFGFGPFYRLPYETPIAGRVPEALQSFMVDFADAVFGRKQFWSSRVYFEDAEISKEDRKKGKNALFAEPKKPHPLMTPNPTSFQLYLEAPEGKAQHWDSLKDVHIRGYKMYWHKNCEDNDWQLDPRKDKEVSGIHTIQPIKGNRLFKGKIRFVDLTAIELGALLAVFDLAKWRETVCYKLGGGKSLGMGTVKIDAHLRIMDRDIAYKSLFDGTKWREPMRDGEMEYEKCLADFRAYMRKKCEAAGSFDAYERLCNDLLEMLDTRHVATDPLWAAKTGRMDLKDFKSRNPLKTIREVLSKDEQLK